MFELTQKMMAQPFASQNSKILEPLDFFQIKTQKKDVSHDLFQFESLKKDGALKNVCLNY